MQVFRDVSGREWRLEIDLPAVKRVRDLSGGNLDLKSTDLARRAAEDAEVAVDVIWFLIQAQAVEQQVSIDDFARAISRCREDKSSPLAEAREALFAEWIDFFHGCGNAKDAAVLATLLAIEKREKDGLRNVVEARRSDVEQTVDQILAEADLTITGAMASAVEEARAKTAEASKKVLTSGGTGSTN